MFRSDKHDRMYSYRYWYADFFDVLDFKVVTGVNALSMRVRRAPGATASGAGSRSVHD